MLHSICQQIWKTQQWPQDWKKSVFILIPNKGNAKECSNYCTIALISHTGKVMLKILQARLQQNVNHELPGVQAGYRKSRGKWKWQWWSLSCVQLFCNPGQNTGVVAFPFSRGSSQPRDQTQVSSIPGRFFTSWATREAPVSMMGYLNKYVIVSHLQLTF